MNGDHRIIVVGVGGAGCKVIAQAAAQAMPGVGWVIVDADRVALKFLEAPQKVLIGRNVTRGLGAGGAAERGRQAAEETSDELSRVLQGAQAVIITCGLGGGTSTGAAPVIGRIAKGLGAWTAGVVTRPFSFEGQRRTRLADAGIEELILHVDALIVTANDGLLGLLDRKTTLAQAFLAVDHILQETIQSLVGLVGMPSTAKPEPADIRAVLPNRDIAVVMPGRATGEGGAG